MRKFRLTLFSLLAISLIFVALGSNPGMAQTKTIRVWDRQQSMEQVVDLFNQKMEEEGKDIRAKFSLIPYDQMVSKFMAALSAGNAPDVYGFDIPQFPHFIEIGAFQDITEQAKSLPYFEDFPKGPLNVGSKDGKIYALPATFDLSGLIWNKDLFEEAGLDPDDPPETWEEFIEYGQKLTKDTNGDGKIDQWGFSVAATGGGPLMFWFGPFIWSNGGAILNQDGTEILFDSPETVEAIELWVDAIHEYGIAPEKSINWNSGDRYNLFISGKLAMFLSGNFNITTIKKDAPEMNFGATFIPKPKDGSFSSYAGGNLIAITKQAEHPEAAWEFVKFYESEEVQVEVLAKNNNLPSRPPLFENKYFKDLPQMKKFAELLEVSRVPYSDQYNSLYDPLHLYMEQALHGKISPEEAARKIDEEMTQIIK